MINPNKSYKQAQIAKIVKLDAPTAYTPYLTVQTQDGRTYEGSLEKVHSQWKKLKVGDLVGFSVQWSIVADKPMLSRITRKSLKTVL